MRGLKSQSVISLIGYAGADPDLKVTPKGFRLAKISMAVSPYRNQSDWFKVAAWGELAEAVMAEVKVGDALKVLGRMRVKRVEVEDGTVRLYPEVTAWSIWRYNGSPDVPVALKGGGRRTVEGEAGSEVVAEDDLPF